MRIDIQTIQHAQQRYETSGDWYYASQNEPDPIMRIRVSALPDWRYEAAVAIHELVEALGCRDKGITQEQVDAFDLAYDGDGEPGEDPKAPYHQQHEFATVIERLIIGMFDLDWEQYDAAVATLSWRDGK